MDGRGVYTKSQRPRQDWSEPMSIKQGPRPQAKTQGQIKKRDAPLLTQRHAPNTHSEVSSLWFRRRRSRAIVDNQIGVYCTSRSFFQVLFIELGIGRLLRHVFGRWILRFHWFFVAHIVNPFLQPGPGANARTLLRFLVAGNAHGMTYR